jgi:hypothetical protein
MAVAEAHYLWADRVREISGIAAELLDAGIEFVDQF